MKKAMTDPAKLDDVHLLGHFTSSTLISERSAYRAETVRRVAAHGLDPKVAEALADGYAEACKAKNMTESMGFEKELLRRMKPPEPPPVVVLPAVPPRPVAAPVAAPARPLRLPVMPPGPPFERNSLHDFFVAVAEYNEHVARESTQFAILCRRMCETIKPEMYKKEEG